MHKNTQRENRDQGTVIPAFILHELESAGVPAIHRNDISELLGKFIYECKILGQDPDAVELLIDDIRNTYEFFAALTPHGQRKEHAGLVGRLEKEIKLLQLEAQDLPTYRDRLTQEMLNSRSDMRETLGGSHDHDRQIMGRHGKRRRGRGSNAA